jgi:hypothetical protein
VLTSQKTAKKLHPNAKPEQQGAARSMLAVRKTARSPFERKQVRVRLLAA